MLKNLLQKIDELKKVINNNAVVFATELHQKFAYIHPFVDGNDSVVRLLMDTLLMCGKLAIWKPVSIDK